ncbi:MAG TPA: hypothetical protein DIW64_17995 [Cellvibrio sp.]|nr:hypothetical protein [Cellvibrio sp.]
MMLVKQAQSIHGKIVHIIVDDKFIDMALRQFDEVSPNNNFPILIGSPRTLRYVKSQNVTFYSLKQAEELFRSDGCTAVIFHSLNDGYLPILECIPAEKKVFWLGWGYDYYDRLLSGAYPDGLLLPETKKMMQISLPLRRMRSLLSVSKKTMKNILFKKNKSIPQMLSRVDYFAPVLDVEYEMARKLNPWFKPKYISWNYGTVEDDLSGPSTTVISTRNNILVGNSAAPENNHLEIFQQLSKSIDLSGREIIVPLSYGDQLYSDKVVEVGKRMFGKQFVPLIDFIPKDKYITLLDSCGYVFMNHLRQQAMGNVFIMMMKGAKVFMNSSSPAYKWLIKKGAVVNSIEELINDSEVRLNALTPISRKAHKINIAITMNHCGRDVQREKTRQLINLALSTV